MNLPCIPRRCTSFLRFHVGGVALCTLLLALTPNARADVVVESPASLFTLVTGSQAGSDPGDLSPAPTPPPSNLGTFDIVINPSVALQGNPAALAAFNRAAQQWESFISDPITVTVDADFSALGSGILGQTGSVILQAGYNTIRNQLVLDAANEADDAIVGSMPTAAQFSANVPTGFGINGNLEATKANLKAIGFTGLDNPVGMGGFGVSDGSIAFSTAFAFDFDKSNGITPGQFDFEGVAAHEIGHLLGFISTVDDIDFIKNQGGTSTAIQPTLLDLFRFADGGASDPATAADFTNFPRSLVPGSTDMFDQINGSFFGSTEVLMSTGSFTGDGRQASHWKDNLALGIMDPTLAPGELAVLGPNDLRAIDLIGYEITVVPEVGAGLMLTLVGALSAAAVSWRRRGA